MPETFRVRRRVCEAMHRLSERLIRVDAEDAELNDWAGRLEQLLADVGEPPRLDTRAANRKLVVTDSFNNRVLIWNSIPTANGTAPDLVLGQTGFTSCDSNQGGSASSTTLHLPAGVWTDGTRLVVEDDGNNRVLIWDNFPTINDQPADLVLGQGDFTHTTPNDDNQDGIWDSQASARTLHDPFDGVDSDGTRLAVTDSSNHRVLVWESFPTRSFQPADLVLGQSDFAHTQRNDDNQDGHPDSQPSARTFDYPAGVRFIAGKTLVVTDDGNSRYLIFNATP